jgi:hypothetical protein
MKTVKESSAGFCCGFLTSLGFFALSEQRLAKKLV